MLKSAITEALGTKAGARVGLSLSRKSPLVVLYHGVTSSKDDSGIRNYRKKHVSTEAFKKQIEWLSKNFSIVPLKDIEKLSIERSNIEKPLCAITFDDGYRNNFTEAYPILKAHGAPATIFVTTGFIDKNLALWPDILEESMSMLREETLTVPWDEHNKSYSLKNRQEKISADMIIRSKLKKVDAKQKQKVLTYLMEKAGVSIESVLLRKDYMPLSWNEIEEMSRNGITIGAHTETHPILSRLSKEEQQKEISVSFEKIRSKIGHCTQFAYPNGQEGDWNEDTITILKGLGVSAAWTTAGRRVSVGKDTAFELPRVTLDNTENMSRFRGLASNTIPFIQNLLK